MSGPRVYVAASSAPAEREHARRVMATLRALGCTVTSTWVEAIDAAGAANEGLTLSDRHLAATVCLDEVESADVLLLLVPPGPSGIGCGVETGYALAMRAGGHPRPAIIAAGRTERTIFAALCDEEHREDSDAIAAVLRLAGER